MGWLRSLDLRFWAVGAALIVALVVLREQIITSIGSAACLERAQFELILCVAPPDAWQIALAGGVALLLAMALGSLLARRPASAA